MHPIRTRRELLAAAGSLAFAGCSASPDGTDREPYTVGETVPSGTRTPTEDPAEERDSVPTRNTPEPDAPTDPRLLEVDGAWPRWRGDVGNTGVADVDAVADEPVEHWRVRGGLPVIDGGVFYHVDRPARTVVARDASTGGIVWTAPIDPVGGIPTVTDDELLIQSSGSLSAYGLDGRRRWETGLSLGSPSSPVAANGLALCCTGSHRTGRSAVSGVDTETGTRRWEFGFNFDVKLGSLASDGTHIYLVTVRGSILSLTTDGRRRWHVDVGRTPASSPLLEDGRLVVVDRAGTSHVLDRESGERTARRALVEELRGARPCIDGNTLYVATRGALFGLEPWTDGQQWRYEFDGDPTALVVDAARAYLGTSDGVVHAIDRDDGTRRWRYPRGEDDAPSLRTVSGIVPVEGALYVSADSTVIAIGPDRS